MTTMALMAMKIVMIIIVISKIMIRVKETSLRIDSGKCLGQRLRFPYNQRCGRDCSFKYDYNQHKHHKRFMRVMSVNI